MKRLRPLPLQPLLASAGLAVGLTLSACAPRGDEAAKEPARGLAAGGIPEGFDFATQHSVALVAETPSEAWAHARVDVRLPDGARVYSGPLSGPVELPLATWVKTLTVTVLAADAEHTFDVPVENGRAVVAVR